MIVVLEDDQVISRLLCLHLEGAGFLPVPCYSVDQANQVLRGKDRISAMLIDLTLPDGNGIDVLRNARGIHRDLPCFVLSGETSLELAVESAVEAVKAGAEDFWVKPLNINDLLNRLRSSVTHYRKCFSGSPELSSPEENAQRWVSPAMRKASEIARAAAAATSTVLITGNKSTGKGSFAKMIHHRGKMKGTSFQQINLATLSPAEIEKELFGGPLDQRHEAMSRGRGALEKSRGGCLYIENIDCLHLAAQDHLMALIEQSRGDSTGKFMCRLIVSSSANLQQAIQEDAFRQDLWYALSVYHVEVPALSERPKDIPLLCEDIITHICVTRKLRRPALTRKALEKILDHTWPGNISELRNAIEHAISRTSDGLIAPGDLPLLSRDPLGVSHSTVPAGVASIEEATKITLIAALAACDGNRRRTAARLKVSLRTIYNMIERYDLQPNQLNPTASLAGSPNGRGG